MTSKAQIVPFDGKHNSVVALLSDAGIDWDNVELAPASEEERRAMAARIAQRDAQAQTPAELFGDDDAVGSGKDFVNKPFRLLDVDYQRSKLDRQPGSLPFYASLTVATPQGEVRVVNCGSHSVVRKAAIAAKNGWTHDEKNPLWLQIVPVDLEGTSNKALDLVAAPAPVAAGTSEAF